MDTTLNRILSLIPKKPDGKFVHGAKKEFCDNIGLPANIISEWQRGKCKSYEHYLYKIADVYGVSVEWLKGETDERKPRALANNDPELTEYLDELRSRTEMRMLFSVSKGATKEQIEAIVHMIEAMQNNSTGE